MTGSAPAGEAAPSRRRQWAFRLAAMTLLPALLLLLLEGALRLGGYGHPTGFFVKIKGQDAFAGNPQFGWRFFPRHLSRTPVLMRVPARKPPGTFRMVMLGSSAAQGTPEPAYAAARILEAMLQERFPALRFEMVNAAMTAMNSHATLPIARDCARLAPDLFIVYMGNNEVVGPFGPGTVFEDFAASRAWIRMGLWARSLKIGQLAQALSAAARRSGPGAADWRGMEMFLNHRVAAADPRLPAVYAHFRENLDDVIDAGRDAGAGVIVSTVAVNLRDNPPFASLHRPGLPPAERKKWEAACRDGDGCAAAGKPAEALGFYQAAAEADDSFAELHFRMARCAYAAGQFEAAREHYRRARDLDALRFRADGDINRVIRETAAARRADGVVLADAEQAFDALSAERHGLPGAEFFYDHVHFNFEGNYRLAALLFERVAALLPDAAWDRQGPPPEPPSRELCAQRLAYTVADEGRMADAIGAIMLQPPFTLQLGHARWREQWALHLRRLQAAQTPPARQQALDLHRRVAAANRDDVLSQYGLGRLLDEQGEHAEAARLWSGLIERLPGQADLEVSRAASQLALGDSPGARRGFDRALDLAQDSPEYYDRIGQFYHAQRRFEEAAGYYRRGLKQAASHAMLHNDLGSSLFELGQVEEARREFEQAVRLNPDNGIYLYNLGAALIAGNRMAEAEEALARSLARDPGNAMAHDRLGVVLARQGKFRAALERFNAGLGTEPDNPELKTHRDELIRHIESSPP